MTPAGRVVTADDIKDWHKSPPPRGNGWSRVGYADMIHISGKYQNLHAYNGDEFVDPQERTWGAKGFNSITRHVVLVGGADADLRPKDTRTREQKAALRNYIFIQLQLNPYLKVLGHNQVNPNKSCPCFDVPAWLKGIGVPLKNIVEGNLWQ